MKKCGANLLAALLLYYFLYNDFLAMRTIVAGVGKEPVSRFWA